MVEVGQGERLHLQLGKELDGGAVVLVVGVGIGNEDSAVGEHTD